MSEMKHSSKAEIFNKKAWSRCAGGEENCSGQGTDVCGDVIVGSRRRILVRIPTRFHVSGGEAYPVGWTDVAFSEPRCPDGRRARSSRRRKVQLDIHLAG